MPRFILTALLLLLPPPAMAVVIDSYTQDTPFLTTGINTDAGGITVSRQVGILGGIISGGVDAEEVPALLDTAGGAAGELFYPAPNVVGNTDLLADGSTAFELDVQGAVGDWTGTVSIDDGTNVALSSVAISGGGVFALPFSDFAGVDLGAAQSIRLLLTSVSGVGSSIQVGEYRTNTTAVPEPGTASMCGLGLLGLAVAGRRRCS